jgi:transposase
MRAFSIAPKARIFVYPEPVSMVYGFPKLEELAANNKHADPNSGDLFVFANKKKTYMKILFFSKNGWCLFCKKLPSGRFERIEGLGARLTFAEMHKLVDLVVVDGKRAQRTNIKKVA